MEYKKVVDDLQQLNLGTILENEPLYKHTTYKVGGPCRIFIKVFNVECLKQLLHYISRHHIPFMVIGKGSNLLFSDREYRGIIISLNDYFTDIRVNGEYMIAQAGVSLIKLSNDACKYALSGLEFCGGIPGSIGGAIFMNAGAYLSEMSRVVEEVTILDEHYEVRVLSNAEMAFSYRRSILQSHPKWIVLEVKLHLKSADRSKIRQLMDHRKEKRMATQPWNLPSAGSVFRNPEKIPAWQCIDECGLRGYEIGGAQISPKHSNFIVNNGYASARDILDLIELARTRVYERFGIRLHTEVRLVNWQDD